MPIVLSDKITPRCPRCSKAVYFGEKISAVGRDWHRACFRCSNENCNAILTAGKESVHDSKPYCNRCHLAIFGPKGYGRGGVESHVFCGGKTGGLVKQAGNTDRVLVNNNQANE